MPTGTVKWFSEDKGYGFIAQDGGGDVFVHHSAIAVADEKGRRNLAEGQKVSYTTATTPKGEQAQNVEVLAS